MAAPTPPPFPESGPDRSSAGAATRRQRPLAAWSRAVGGEVCATLAAMGQFLSVALQTVVALLMRAARRRNAELARRRFGEQCYKTAPDDNPLSRNIADLDQAIAALRAGKKSTRRQEVDTPARSRHAGPKPIVVGSLFNWPTSLPPLGQRTKPFSNGIRRGGALPNRTGASTTCSSG